MINTLIATILTPLVLGFIGPTPQANSQPADKVLAVKQFSLDDRYAVSSVNEVFKKNILLNLAYMDKSVVTKQDINWDNILQPFHSEFELKPNETFAYHDQVLPEYQGKVAVTTHTTFGATDGYVSDGYLFGDGVCHLASLINWVAQEAKLNVQVTKNHDFAIIPDVPKEYGVAIFADPNNPNTGANRNLYITNNLDHNVKFSFDYENDELKVVVTEVS